MKNINHIIIAALAAVVVLSFFLPWVIASSSQVGFVSKVLTGKEQSDVARISAFQVPVYANGEESRLMISIIKILKPQIENADKKSYLIWLIPILAVIIFLLIFFIGDNPWVNIAIGILGVLIFVVALYKIKTTDLDKMVLQIKIGIGLWLTLLGYLGMGLTCLVKSFELLKKKMK